jgi:hypothetical protein
VGFPIGGGCTKLIDFAVLLVMPGITHQPRPTSKRTESIA